MKILAISGPVSTRAINIIKARCAGSTIPALNNMQFFDLVGATSALLPEHTMCSHLNKTVESSAPVLEQALRESASREAVRSYMDEVWAVIKRVLDQAKQDHPDEACVMNVGTLIYAFPELMVEVDVYIDLLFPAHMEEHTLSTNKHIEAIAKVWPTYQVAKYRRMEMDGAPTYACSQGETYVELRAATESTFVEFLLSITDHPYFRECVNYFSTFFWSVRSISGGLSRSQRHTMNNMVSCLTDFAFTGDLDAQYVAAICLLTGKVTGLSQYVHKDSLVEYLGREAVDKGAGLAHLGSTFRLCGSITPTEEDKLTLSLLSVLKRSPEEIVENEIHVFRSSDFTSYPVFKRQRIKDKLEMRNVMRSRGYCSTFLPGLELSLSHEHWFQPKIVWYCGSFDPFHVGNEFVVHELERLFDKVVLVQDTDKGQLASKEYTVIQCRGLSLDYLIEQAKYVPVLAFVRNSADVQQADGFTCERLRSTIPGGIQIVTIDMPAKYAHISSEWIAQNPRDCSKYVVKI